MIRIEPSYMGTVPAGQPFIEWRNTTGRWLRLEPPGATEPIQVAPGCPMQVKLADLTAYPWLAAWIEGLELKGVLTRVGG